MLSFFEKEKRNLELIAFSHHASNSRNGPWTISEKFGTKMKCFNRKHVSHQNGLKKTMYEYREYINNERSVLHRQSSDTNRNIKGRCTVDTDSMV